MIQAASEASTPIRPRITPSNADEAGKLRDRVRGLGFGAFIEQVNTDKGTLTRVLAGPVSSREQAEQLKSQVAARTGINGLVRAHP